MKQGRGQMTQQNGSVFKGVWDANIIVGSGKVTIQVGDKNKRDGLPKEVSDKLCAHVCDSCSDLIRIFSLSFFIFDRSR